MPHLSPRDRELVALGAAMGSNCVPCIEYHTLQARKAGLTDSEIADAIRLADRVRRVPARKVLEVALQMVTATPGSREVVQSATIQPAQSQHSTIKSRTRENVYGNTSGKTKSHLMFWQNNERRTNSSS